MAEFQLVLSGTQNNLLVLNKLQVTTFQFTYNANTNHTFHCSVDKTTL